MHGEREEREIWIVSNFPPPVHGVSAFNRDLSDFLAKQAPSVTVRRFAIGTRGSFADLEKFAFAKVLADLSVLSEVFFSALKMAFQRALGRGHAAVTLYLTPSQMGINVIRDLLTVLTASPARPRVVAHLHGCRWLDTWSSGRGGPIAQLMRFTLARCDRVIALGKTYAQRMREEAGLNNVIGIDNGVELNRHRHERQAAGDRPPPDTRVEILFLSNFLRAKGLWIVLEAAKIILDRGCSFRLRCAGAWYNPKERTDFEKEWRAFINAHPDTIQILPFVDGDAKARLMESSQVFVLPTLNRCEGQPLSMIEAMGHGLVPLTTPFGGIPDLFDFDAADRFLCRPEHATGPGLADTLQRLIEDSVLRAQYSAKVLQKHSRDLTFERCANQVLEVLECVTK